MKKIAFFTYLLFLMGCGATYQAEYARLMDEYNKKGSQRDPAIANEYQFHSETTYQIDGNTHFLPRPMTPDEKDIFITDLEKKLQTDPEYIFKEEYKVKQEQDLLEHITYTFFENRLDSQGLYREYGTSLYVIKKEQKNKIPEYFLCLEYSSDMWAFIYKVDMYIDNKKIPINIGGRQQSVSHYATITEKFTFHTTKQQIGKISKAKNIALRIYGEEGYFDRILTPQNIYNFQRFYNEEMK